MKPNPKPDYSVLHDVLNEAAMQEEMMSGLAPVDPQAHSSAFAVAGGWVPVCEAEALCAEWEMHASTCRRLAMRATQNPRNRLVAERKTYDRCVYELRKLVESAKKRQPAPNKASQQRAD